MRTHIPNCLLRIIAAIVLGSVAGCSSLSGPTLPVRSDPQAAAQRAMESYDTNGDGKIAGPELNAFPALLSAIARIDTNQDEAITPDEIAQRLTAYQSQSTFVDVMIHVTRNGAPIAGAVVTLTPEPFLGDGFQVFEGTSDARGRVIVAGRDAVTPGVPTGLYSVTIAAESGAHQTSTGCEISDDAGNRLEFSL